MQEFLANLIIGIVGGVFSSVIVSRIFLIRSELQEQIDLLKLTSYQFSSLSTYFTIIEKILKLSSDTSPEIERAIQNDPNYIKTHDLIHSKDAINSIKTEFIDKIVDDICNRDYSLILKNKYFLSLQNETVYKIKKYKTIKEFKFKTIDECKLEINDLKTKYDHCIAKKRKVFLGLIVKDIILIVFAIIFVTLCVLLALSIIKRW